MSLTMSDAARALASFPRVSGDEPGWPGIASGIPGFSPRERG